jgi:branched-chain amino acid transport system permease protein
MSMEDFLALLVSGLTQGALYAMAAVSLNIAYKPTNVFNMAQGDLLMLGAMFAAGIMAGWPMPWLAALALVLLLVGAIGLVEERLAVAPLLRNAAQHHGWIISTLAFSIIIVNASDRIWGSDPRAVPPVPGTSIDTLQFGALSFSTAQLAVIVLAVASIACIEWFYRGTLAGKAVRAVAEDRDGARLNGISPLKLTIGSFVAAAMYSAFTGVIAAPLVLASTSLGLGLLVKGFMALAIGGVGSNWGALAAGLMIGCVESLSSINATPGYRQLLLLAVLLAVLMVRPYGFFGKPGVREV